MKATHFVVSIVVVVIVPVLRVRSWLSLSVDSDVIRSSNNDLEKILTIDVDSFPGFESSCFSRMRSHTVVSTLREKRKMEHGQQKGEVRRRHDK